MSSHPRSILRSRLFWLALPGLIFLLWGWFNDPGSARAVQLTLGDHYLSITDDGCTFLAEFEAFAPRHWTAPGFDYGQWSRAAAYASKEEEQLFPKAIHFVMGTRYTHFKIAANLSYWLLILLYLAALIPTWLWWQRRKTRLATSAHPQPSATHS